MESVLNGKDAQEMLSAKEYDCVVLNENLKDHNCVEVSRYFRAIKTKARLVLARNPENSQLLTENSIKKMRPDAMLVSPYNTEDLGDAVEYSVRCKGWRNPVKDSNRGEQDEDVHAECSEFQPVKISEFFGGSPVIMDVYLMLRPGRYLKIIYRGDAMDYDQIKRYSEKGVKNLYFKKSERPMYIDYLGNMTDKLNRARRNQEPSKGELYFAKNMVAMMAQEIYTSGITRFTIAETVKMCERVHSIVSRSGDLNDLAKRFMSISNSVEDHLFLTVLFTDFILQNTEWSTDKTRCNILMGAFLHEIGKLGLSGWTMEADLEELDEMDNEEKQEYQTYCQRGYDIVRDYHEIGSDVKQIILQHQERLDGSGFPRKLSGRKIYPPARIVGFAHYMAERCHSKNISPKEAFKSLSNEAINNEFDPNVVTSFLRGLSPVKKTGCKTSGKFLPKKTSVA